MRLCHYPSRHSESGAGRGVRIHMSHCALSWGEGGESPRCADAHRWLQPHYIRGRSVVSGWALRLMGGDHLRVRPWGGQQGGRSAGGGAPGPGAVRPSQHPGTGGPLDPDRQGRAQSWPSAHLANISQQSQNQTTDNYTGMWTKKVSFSNASTFDKGTEKTQRLRGSEIVSE